MDEGSKSFGSSERADGSAMVCGMCGPLCCLKMGVRCLRFTLLRKDMSDSFETDGNELQMVEMMFGEAVEVCLSSTRGVLSVPV